MPEQKSAPLFTSKFSQGRRAFFFDVRKTKNDKPYLRITSSSIKGEEKQRNFMTIFDNEMMEFCQAISEAANFVSNTKVNA